mmetsp:Transcript_2845/g.7820  ORF Transcript_2845/g.7820 Transcript_2845/m.7820 type:complete len:86 (+) Transcript_2845:1606-1863(+)
MGRVDAFMPRSPAAMAVDGAIAVVISKGATKYYSRVCFRSRTMNSDLRPALVRIENCRFQVCRETDRFDSVVPAVFFMDSLGLFC